MFCRSCVWSELCNVVLIFPELRKSGQVLSIKLPNDPPVDAVIMCVCVCVCVCVRACVRACVRVCVHAFVYSGCHLLVCGRALELSLVNITRF